VSAVPARYESGDPRGPAWPRYVVLGIVAVLML
jgi:hypothetical protein